MGGCVVRPMGSGDAEAVSELVTQLGYTRNAAEVVGWLEALGTGIERMAYVACVGGEVVGWVEVSVVRALQSEAHGLIGGLVVKDGLRGQGVGRELCQAAETWCWERGLRVLRVTSRSTREAAHRFYLRDGYRLVKTSAVFERERPGEAETEG